MDPMIDHPWIEAVIDTNSPDLDFVRTLYVKPHLLGYAIAGDLMTCRMYYTQEMAVATLEALQMAVAEHIMIGGTDGRHD